jgi:tetratricopeptide (TPR) repeat protein
MAMRWIYVMAAAMPLLLASAGPAAAESPAVNAPAPPNAAAAAERESLFAELAAAKTEADARAIEDRIWTFWLKAPDERSRELLEEAKQARLGFDYRGALTALGKLIEHVPDYSEGWNQRAYVLFLMGAHSESLEAIEETLKREPKHYGALAGKGVILLMQGQDAQGQAALKEALKINPWLKERGLITDAPERKI